MSWLDMLPQFTAYYCANKLSRNIVAPSHFPLCGWSVGVIVKNLQNNIISEFGDTASASSCPATLCHHVSAVNGAGSQKQMSSANIFYPINFIDTLFIIAQTVRYITRMQDIHSIRDGFPGGKYPGDTVNAFALMTNGDSSIASPERRAGPKPTRCGLVDAVPEERNRPGSATVIVTGGATELPLAPTEWLTTVGTETVSGRLIGHRRVHPSVSRSGPVSAGAAPFACSDYTS